MPSPSLPKGLGRYNWANSFITLDSHRDDEITFSDNPKTAKVINQISIYGSIRTRADGFYHYKPKEGGQGGVGDHPILGFSASNEIFGG